MEILIGVAIIVIVYLSRKRLGLNDMFAKYKQSKKQQTEKKQQTDKVDTKKIDYSNSVSMFVLLAGVCAVLFFVTRGDFVEVTWNMVAPYVFAPLIGVFAYYMENCGYKNLTYAILVTITASLAIYLWIHPEMLKSIVTPFIGGPVDKLTGSDSKQNVFAVILLIIMCGGGRTYKAIVLGIALMIFW